MSKICVVGGGRWGKNHISTLNQIGQLGGLVEQNPELLQKYKTELKDIKTFLHVEDALEADFSGFTIATPANTHFEIASKIIKAGKNVLIEKPITLKSQEAIDLKQAAIENNVNVMVGHVLLFHPAFRKIKSLLDEGILGDLQYLYSNRLNLGTIRSEENVFWSLAPHDISLFQYFTNSFPTTVTSRGLDVAQRGIHDTTITIIEYPGNIMGHIFVSWLHPFKEHRFVLVGSKGMIRFEDSLEGKPLVFYDKNVDWKNNIPIPHSGPSYNIEYAGGMPLTEELTYFCEHLKASKFDICNIDSAIEVMKILELSTNSLENNC